MDMEFINLVVLSQVPKKAKRILDLGCGDGRMAGKLKESQECSVVGVNISEVEAKLASQWLDKVIVSNLNNFDTSNLGKFDCIICSHILEHLYQPQQFLMQLHRNLSPDGILIVALPNILWWRKRLSFLAGEFKYIDGTATAHDHIHFFDWKTSRQLIEGSGYEILSRCAGGNFPLPFIRNLIPAFAQKIDRIALKLRPGVFGFQFVITARSRIDKPSANIDAVALNGNI